MRALLFYNIVFTAGALAACAGQSNHKIGITRKLPNQKIDSANVSAKAQALLDASKNNKCLDVDGVVRELTKDATIYSVYTSDLDLGQLKNVSGGSDKCVEFVPNGDAPTRAFAFLKSSNDLRPQIETLAGTDLTGSTQVGAYLSVTGQEKCANVALLKGAFTVLCKSPRQITVQGSVNNSSAVITYALNAKNLEITTFVPMRALPNCKSNIPNGTVVKRKTIISWAGTTDRMLMPQPFAQLFQTYLVTKPAELTSALANANAKATLPLSAQTYTYMINMLSLDKKIDAALTCN